jgi:hypothetical protein
MHTLLRAWQPGESEASLARRALAEDLLGKATAKRARDVVHVFARRLLIPRDQPARHHLKPLTDGDGPRQVLSDLLFYTAGDAIRSYGTSRWTATGPPLTTATYRFISIAAAATESWEMKRVMAVLEF